MQCVRFPQLCLIFVPWLSRNIVHFRPCLRETCILLPRTLRVPRCSLDTRRGDRRPTNHNAFAYYLRRRGIGEGGEGWRGEGGLNGGLFVSLMSVPSSCLFDLLGRVVG